VARVGKYRCLDLEREDDDDDETEEDAEDEEEEGKATQALDCVLDTLRRLLQHVSSAISPSAQSFTEDGSNVDVAMECTIQSIPSVPVGTLELVAFETGASDLITLVCSAGASVLVGGLSGKTLGVISVDIGLTSDCEDK
jgi:hypothetical protein